MANPVLNERAGSEAARNPGWGAPDPATRNAPITDGPVTPWQSQVMTVDGTVTASGVLLVMLIAAAVVGWEMGPTNAVGRTGFPALALVGILVGFACVIAIHFKPMWATSARLRCTHSARASSSALSPRRTTTPTRHRRSGRSAPRSVCSP